MPAGNYALTAAPPWLPSAPKVIRKMAVCTTTQPTRPAKRQGEARESVPLLADSGPMTLRVRGPGQDARMIEIRSPKCTIGSAEGCTLRLRAAGVGRLHCWILRGPRGAIVRRLHGAATLNGGRFRRGDAGCRRPAADRLGGIGNGGLQPAITAAIPAACASGACIGRDG